MAGNLIEEFLELRKKQLNNGINADVLFYINKDLKTSYQHGRLNEWVIGKKKPSAVVVQYMTRYILEDELTQLKTSKQTIKRIINRCSLPVLIESGSKL